jgi:DNA-binding IclR family transcriptional regulator
MLHITDDGKHTDGKMPRRSVLNRAASIMEAFNGSHRVLSLNELSRRANLPKSTAHRFAEQLLELGWLEREFAGYRVGMRLFEVGSLAERRNKLRDKALPHLHQLALHTGMAVNFGILDEQEVLYLERMPLRGFHLPTRDGGRMPASCTGLGKALLAFSTDDDVRAVIDEGLPKLTAASIVNPDALEAELDKIRGGGIAYDVEEACEGVSCVAAPVRSSGRAIAAVSVASLTSDFDSRLATSAVRRAANAIWSDLFPSARFAS